VVCVDAECARLLHKGSARLVLCGPSWDKLESLSDALCSDSDPSVTFTPKLVLLDFNDIDSLQEVSNEVLECYGCVDVLICNSSMKVKAPVQNTSLEMDKSVMDVNYFGPITLAKAVLPSMISRRSGHFLLVNSIQGRLSVPFRTSYAASKHAVQAFFDCLRAEVEEYGISVSTISHTFINATQQRAQPLPFLSTYPKLRALSACESTQVRVNERQEDAPCLFPSLFFAVVGAGVKDGSRGRAAEVATIKQ
uniref:Dehydrogenase/reductase (SDR family) member 7C n=1 Tax=Denticeps clupeoides TaxID=299321 RepID=A0AAY4CA04_9TELE